MKHLLIFHLLIVCVFSFSLLFFLNAVSAKSFALGGGISFFNLLLNGLLANSLFRTAQLANKEGKKPVARFASVIVFKYPLLAFILYVAVRNLKFSPLWIVLGITSFLLTALVEAFRSSRSRASVAKEGDRPKGPFEGQK